MEKQRGQAHNDEVRLVAETTPMMDPSPALFESDMRRAVEGLVASVASLSRSMDKGFDRLEGRMRRVDTALLAVWKSGAAPRRGILPARCVRSWSVPPFD